MAKTTLTEMIQAGLIAMGATEVPVKSSKYKAYHLKGRSYNYFVGKAGALRIGKTPTNSTAVLEQTKQKVADRGRQALGL